MSQGIGIYFIAKSFFVGPALWLYGRQTALLERLSALMEHDRGSGKTSA